jgi:hypothetical protein
MNLVRLHPDTTVCGPSRYRGLCGCGADVCSDCDGTGVVRIPDDLGDQWSPPAGPWTYRLCDCVSEPIDGDEDYR